MYNQFLLSERLHDAKVESGKEVSPGEKIEPSGGRRVSSTQGWVEVCDTPKRNGSMTSVPHAHC